MWRGMNVSFRDMLFLLVFAYLVIGAIALAHVAKNDQEQSKGQAPPGNVIVEMFWDKAVDADVDLWVQAPGDVPVGYSNKSGVVFNLVRDDLGRSGDPNSMNYEVSYGRGHWPGEYVVNAMLYRSRDRKFPVGAQIKVSLAFISLALVLGAFAYVAVPAGSRGRRAVIAGFFAVILGAVFFGYSDMLGRPKSTQLEVFRTSMPDAKVIGSYLKENDGVYLWLQLPGLAEPRYYKLPWDEKVAKALQSAIGENERQHGSGVGMGLPFERSWDRGEPKFYALPQPKLPDKPGERPPVTVFQAPEQGI